MRDGFAGKSVRKKHRHTGRAEASIPNCRRPGAGSPFAFGPWTIWHGIPSRSCIRNSLTCALLHLQMSGHDQICARFLFRGSSSSVAHNDSQQRYINFPSAVAQVMPCGAVFEWIVRDKNHRLPGRRKVFATALKKRHMERGTSRKRTDRFSRRSLQRQENKPPPAGAASSAESRPEDARESLHF